MRIELVFVTGCCLAAAPAWAQSDAQASQLDTLRNLSIEELANLPITSVSRRPEPLSETPASVYVIRNEDIQNSGATSLPEALRLAPNLNVARDSASAYAISSRGFNSFETANKELVLIDGRSVYAPLHSGVFWDEQPLLLDDVDRIEVISGPGGTLYGANAVNGVINVTTRDAFASQGVLARAGYGSVDESATLRYGGMLGSSGAYRVYALGFDRANSLTPRGLDAQDEFSGLDGGFRADIDAGGARWTAQGDIFSHQLDAAGDVSGGNVLARWSRSAGDGSSLQLQAYYDRSERSGPGVTTRTSVSDISIQQVLAPMGRHKIVWGGGYRYIDDLFDAVGLFTLDPSQRSFDLWNAFAQDTVALADGLAVTAGIKLEDSGYSGFQYLPSVRLSWTPDEGALIWAAVSRAVRTPVRLDRDLVAPGIFIANPDYTSEKLIAYEAGYRGHLGSRLSGSISAFYNSYDDLRTTELSPAGGFPAHFGNGYAGATYGIEVWGDYQAANWWRLSAGLTTLHKDFHLKAGATDIADPPSTGNDPDYQLIVRSQMQLSPTVALGAAFRVQPPLPSPHVPGYNELDARLAWRVTSHVELSVNGANLLDAAHAETDADNIPLETRRSLQVGAKWVF